jgi:hypothetical protein
MIPPLIHFIYVGGRPFSFIHYLAVLTASTVHRPARLLMHCTEIPAGPWWDQAHALLEIHRVAPVTAVQGNPVVFPAHQADVIRLDVLRRLGGIYLDLDVISLRPFTPLLDAACVMGIEAGTGLCNAVILARPDSVFLQRWQGSYHDFDGSRWNQHSVVVPAELARCHPETIRIAPATAFFYPAHNDPAHYHLWGETPPLREIAVRVGKNLLRLASDPLGRRHSLAQRAQYRCFHALRSRRWHERQLAQSYCLHLWEGLWGRRYLDAVTPDYVQHADTPFARLIRRTLPWETVARLSDPPAMPQRRPGIQQPPCVQPAAASAVSFSMR